MTWLTSVLTTPVSAPLWWLLHRLFAQVQFVGIGIMILVIGINRNRLINELLNGTSALTSSFNLNSDGRLFNYDNILNFSRTIGDYSLSSPDGFNRISG